MKTDAKEMVAYDFCDINYQERSMSNCYGSCDKGCDCNCDCDAGDCDCNNYCDNDK